MYHLISNFNGVLLLGWGILHPVCASRRHFLAIVTSSSKNLIVGVIYIDHQVEIFLRLKIL